jgi:hypothetical protein
VLKTYLAEKSGLKITTSSGDYMNGKPVTLYSLYTDQMGREMTENTSNISWTIVEGQGKFEDQADTSVVFIPVAIGRVLIGASEGDLTKNIDLYVNSLPTTMRNVTVESPEVYPNPVNETVCFQFAKLTENQITIMVFDALGKQIIEKTFNIPNQEGSKIELNTSQLQNGVYIYGTYSGTEVVFGRFVK